MRVRTVVVAVILSSLIWTPSVMAQQRHIVDPAVMHQAIADQVEKDQQNRDAVLGILQHSQVRDLADRLGLSVTRAERALSALDSTELERLAGQARTADAQLAGGANTVVISTTALLLLIIIVILIAR